jgi:hypothetical protein
LVILLSFKIQISLHRLLSCHVWSSSASLSITGLIYYPTTNRCLWEPPLDMSNLQLLPPLISHVCHRSKHDLFLCDHKSIVACASQLHLIVGHVTFFSRPILCSIQHGWWDRSTIEFVFYLMWNPRVTHDTRSLTPL